MHVTPTQFGVAACVVALVEGYCYNLSILGFTPWLSRIPKEKWTVPSLSAWTILFFEGFIIALSYYQRHDMNAFWFFAAFAVEYLIAAILAIWYGEHTIEPELGQEKPVMFRKLDLFCIAVALASIGVWYCLGSWDIPVAMNIAIDLLGIAFIIKKVKDLPESEDLRSWVLTLVSCTLGVLALGDFHSWTFEHAGFPIYFLGINAVVLILLLRRYPLVKRILRF